MLASLVLMVLFKPLGHDYDSRYLKQTILAFQVLPDQPKMASMGYFGIMAKLWVLDTLHPIEKSYDVFCPHSEVHIKQFIMLGKYFGRVEPTIFQTNRGCYLLLDETPYSHKQASISCSVNHGPPKKCFGFNVSARALVS